MLQPKSSWFNSKGQLWLNVGSGPYPLKEFVNLDNHVFMRVAPLYPFAKRLLPDKYSRGIRKFYDASAAATFVRYDCRRPLQIPAASVDHILCSHFLEHLYPDQAREVMRGFRRALKLSGTVHIIVPDLDYLVRTYIENSLRSTAADTFMEATMLTNATPPSWRYRLLEAIGHDGLRHHWLYDRRSLERLLVSAGFDIVTEVAAASGNVRKDEPDSLHVSARPREL
jgi:predicted SAM-dependent methyltransferase